MRRPHKLRRLRLKAQPLMEHSISMALDEAQRVVKKQRTCAKQTSDVLDGFLAGLMEVQQAARQNPATSQSLLLEFSSALSREDHPTEVTKVTKDLHSSVAKLGKAMEKAFINDVSQAHRDIPFDRPILEKVIAAHFFQEGMFEAGDLFLEEAGIPDGEAIKQPYKAMHAILQQIQAGNLGPALQWAEANRQQLIHSSSEARVNGFEFKLHRLQFLDIREKSGFQSAIQYARQHFGRFKDTQLPGIQRLMGLLCFSKRPGRGPYDDLTSPALWEDAAHDFSRHCCGLIGQASESPLLVAVAAGSAALPTLLKLASLLRDHSHDLVSGEQLPVELELGQEFVFRSVFSCPVSREQSSPSNPPTLLPCGHVLCKQSILKIAKSATRSFKCPYCPQEASLAACYQLYFPPTF